MMVYKTDNTNKTLGSDSTKSEELRDKFDKKKGLPLTLTGLRHVGHLRRMNAAHVPCPFSKSMQLCIQDTQTGEVKCDASLRLSCHVMSCHVKVKVKTSVLSGVTYRQHTTTTRTRCPSLHNYLQVAEDLSWNDAGHGGGLDHMRPLDARRAVELAVIVPVRAGTRDARVAHVHGTALTQLRLAPPLTEADLFGLDDVHAAHALLFLARPQSGSPQKGEILVTTARLELLRLEVLRLEPPLFSVLQQDLFPQLGVLHLLGLQLVSEPGLLSFQLGQNGAQVIRLDPNMPLLPRPSQYLVQR